MRVRQACASCPCSLSSRSLNTVLQLIADGRSSKVQRWLRNSRSNSSLTLTRGFDGRGLPPKQIPLTQSGSTGKLLLVAREWGRILNLECLEAGDLLLFRSSQVPLDRVSAAIVTAQTREGSITAARWTHAAVDLGDVEHICERTSDDRLPPRCNRRSIRNYARGSCDTSATTPNMPLSNVGIAVGALHNLHKSYSLHQIWQFFYAATSGRGFQAGGGRGPFG